MESVNINAVVVLAFAVSIAALVIPNVSKSSSTVILGMLLTALAGLMVFSQILGQ